MQAFARLSEGLSAGLGFIAIIDPRMPIALAFTAKIIFTRHMLDPVIIINNIHQQKYRQGIRAQRKSVLSGFLEALRRDKQQRPKQHRVLMTTFFYAASQSIVLINIFWMIQVTANMIELSHSIWTSMSLGFIFFTLLRYNLLFHIVYIKNTLAPTNHCTTNHKLYPSLYKHIHLTSISLDTFGDVLIHLWIKYATYQCID